MFKGFIQTNTNNTKQDVRSVPNRPQQMAACQVYRYPLRKLDFVC